MRKILCVIAALCAIPATTIYAQSRNISKDSATTVIIFNQSSAERGKKKISGENNIVKIAPAGFISGVFPLSFEKRITDYLGIQVSGGLTHKNYLRGAIVKNEETDVDYTYPWGKTGEQYQSDDMVPGIHNFENGRKPKTGYMYSIQPRFYYESDALDGIYLGLSYDFYRYNFETTGFMPVSGGSLVIDNQLHQEHEKITDYMVHFGQQHVYDRLTMDWSVGLGVRNVKGEKYAATTSGGTFTDGMAVYKQNILNVGIGFKIGYHF